MLVAATTLSMVAFAQLQEPGIVELQSNEEYRNLHRENRRLEMREDSVMVLIAEAKDRFRQEMDSLAMVDSTAMPSRERVDAYTGYILGLEQEVFDIRTERGDVIARINAMEQEWVLAQMNAPVEEEPVEEETPVVEQVEQRRNLYDNAIFADALYAEDYAELRVAHAEDEAMDSLARDYGALYERLSETASRYLTTDDEAEADSLFIVFASLKAEAETMNAAIERSWNHVIDTKYYALGYILERERHYDLLDGSSQEFAEMRREASREVGYYASDALMHYAKGRPTLRRFERDFAQTMSLALAADSLATTPIAEVEHRYEPISLERRLFIDYAPITIGRTNYYKESNPVPELKVYERGTIYRILLGEFRNKQPMTLFKGVQPLYIDRDDEGHYIYYAGGFATRLEADEAQLFLKEKGFKAPEICRWQDGTMVNITSAVEEDANVDIPVVGKRYMVQIAAEGLGDELRALIEREAPAKAISRLGGGFAVGAFDSRDEAEMLAALVEESGATVGIVEIELNE